MKIHATNHFFKISVFLLLIFRLLLTAFLPLLDKTEARYAEISRIMWETQDWVVLHIDYGIPFWAKPPLSAWLSALSFGIFGITEFASRLPSFLLSVLIIFMAGKFAKRSGAPFYLPGFILLTMPEFLIHTGVVSTDTALCFCIMLIMVSFWETMNNGKPYWNYLFFIGIALGFLAKGPLVLVLTFPPLFLWCWQDRKRFRILWDKFSWAAGIIIIAVIAIPWYYLAENQSPGFLNYFLVGEHFKRFVEPGWKGDLYGSPKSQPFGMIWVFLILFAFPWIEIAFSKIWKRRSSLIGNKWVSFLIFWLFWTPIFFTLSGNILHTYILPVTIPLMFLIVHWWREYNKKEKMIRIALVFPIVVFLACLIFPLTGKAEYYMNSDKYLLGNNNPGNKSPVYYWREKSYSGQFYTHGKAQLVKNEIELDSVLALRKKIFLVMLRKKQKDFPEKYKDRFVLADSNYKTLIFASEP